MRNNIVDMFGAPFEPPTQRYVESPEEQLRDAMSDAGLIPPFEIVLDGELRRFGKDKSCWYVGHSNVGCFGDWKTGDNCHIWHADQGRELSIAENLAQKKILAELKTKREAEKFEKHQSAAISAQETWLSAQEASDEHPYLVKKGIPANGARIAPDGRLILPLMDGGEISSLQYISPDGSKLFFKGGEVAGKYWRLDGNNDVIYICEGFATAASIHRVTNSTTYMAFSASNIPKVAKVLREKHGIAQVFVVVADNDKSGVGLKYANEVTGVRIVMPDIEGMDANDYEQSGHDLAALLKPPVENWFFEPENFASQPAPIKWLIKGWIQENALIMMHGPSGGGKTFTLLSMLSAIASGLPDWFGHKVNQGDVFYLAGEGHHGLRGRIAAWCQETGNSNKIYISKSGCDLNTPEGYLKIVENIRITGKKPKIIAVDTLHRFLLGDENSSQDAKVFLDACAGLMAEFNCSVILVHHTGVSEAAQHRARGSSAWRGALDIEISIKAGNPIEIIQMKNKDAEESPKIYAKISSVKLNSWFDEDGEPVTSAILEQAEPPRTKTEDALLGHVKTFERAWFASGCEIGDNNNPYVSRSALQEFLISKLGFADRTAQNALKPSNENGLIAQLLKSEIIAIEQHGWAVVNDVYSSGMLLNKGD